jgi:predicted CXXCH cytochrome family protein
MKYFIVTAIVFITGYTASAQSGSEQKGCKDCHSELIGQKVVHAVAADDCETCHSSNGSQHPGQGGKGFDLAEKVPALCFMCHDMQTAIDTAKVKHKVVNDAKGCLNCHSPHTSDNEKLLIKNGKDLCLGCHNRSIKTEDRRIVNIGQFLKKGNMVHGAIELDGCTVCHNPHASEQISLLKGAFPTGFYTSAKAENFELCFICHDQELLTSERSATATQFRNGDQNLHFLHMNGQKGRSCKVCHNVHGSALPHLINDKVIFGNWIMPVQYKAEENGGSCNTGCHSEKKYLR